MMKKCRESVTAEFEIRTQSRGDKVYGASCSCL